LDVDRHRSGRGRATAKEMKVEIALEAHGAYGVSANAQIKIVFPVISAALALRASCYGP
jgi:hypothetical protein